MQYDSIDRFKFVIHLVAHNINPKLKYNETLITYAFHGKEKTAINLQKFRSYTKATQLILYFLSFGFRV